MAEVSLVATNTFGKISENSELITCRNKDGRQKNQIDYICASDHTSMTSCSNTASGPPLHSDYVLLVGHVSFDMPIFSTSRSASGWKGWRLQSSKATFQEAMLRHSGFPDRLSEADLGNLIKSGSLPAFQDRARIAFLNSTFQTSLSANRGADEFQNKCERFGTVWDLDGADQKMKREAYLHKRRLWKTGLALTSWDSYRTSATGLTSCFLQSFQ